MIRVDYEVRFEESHKNGNGFVKGRAIKGYWRVFRGKAKLAKRLIKTDAVRFAITEIRARWHENRQLSELTIKTMDGKIEDKRTYPRSSDNPKIRG